MKLFGPLYDRCRQLAAHRHAPWYLGVTSAIESIFFPVPPDVMLAPMSLARPTHWWRYALLTTLTSVLGGLIGYALIKFGFEPAPLLLGFVLGRLMEENLRRALIIGRGDATVFVQQPISAALLAVAAILLIIALLPSIRKSRDEVFTE